MIATCRRESAEVLYSDRGIEDVSKADIDELKGLAAANPRKRVRLCAHHQPSDKLHEMLIVHEKAAYVRPHKHPGKTESTHIIEGLVDVVVFDDDGGISRVLELGEYQSGRTFYCRMDEQSFHTLLIRSDVLVFHETTNGPFDRKDTLFAPWAPADGDEAAAIRFISELQEKVNRTRTATK